MNGAHLMSDPIQQTPLLSLPYIQAAQAQKHVTHNAAIERLDMVVQLTLEATDATTPPANAPEGQAWALGPAPTGAWAGQAGDIAAWRGGGWLFVTPQTGWRAWDKTTSTVMVFDGGWMQQAGAADYDNLSGVGVNAASDATNRLAVAADATLLTHDGSDHQLKINKAAATDTASLLFQSGFAGRAEMGLAGNDDFAVKVSADGTTFTESLRIDAATGIVTLPATGARQILPVNYRYYMYADKRWVGPSSNGASLNASANLGSGAEPNVDWDAKGVYLPAGTTVRSFTLAGHPSSPEIADIDTRIYFNHGPWNGPWDSVATTTRVMLDAQDAGGVIGTGGMRQKIFTLDYVTPADGYLALAARADAGSTLGGTRYFYLSGAIDITLPA